MQSTVPLLVTMLATGASAFGLHAGAALRPLANPRAQPVVALGEFSDIATTLASSHAALPPGFEGFAKPEHHTFTYYLMNAVGTYVLLNAACTFGPRVKAALLHAPPPELVKAPVSKFGWLRAHLREPLPAKLEDLREHPIGTLEGRRVFLCSEKYLIESRKVWQTIEVSEDFTEHYQEGERVYVCTL